MIMAKIKIGDTVIWRGIWGLDNPFPATVTGIELCERYHEKEGAPVNEIEIEYKDNCVFSLDNGHWAYGDQITITEE